MKGNGIAIYNNNFALSIKNLKILAGWLAGIIKYRSTFACREDITQQKRQRFFPI